MSALLDAVDASPPIIERVALVIARDAYPRLHARRYLMQLDAWAERAHVAEGAALEDRVAALAELVYGKLGFAGNSDDYYDPRNSYLNEVVDRRLGIPITLAIVLMALGRRLGLTVEGIGFPGHFLARVGGAGGVYVDPFNGGSIVARGQLEVLARRVLPDSDTLVSGQLEPVTARVMAVRMLFNLQQIYEKRGDHARALVVCDRLVDLTGTAFHRRDRGIHALRLRAFEAARRDLEAYLETDLSDGEAARVRQLIEEASQGRVQLN
jgi:regulator of sirC expression with transglutaminase-like and TPR domain